MNIENIKAHLTEWEMHAKEIGAQYDALRKLTGLSPESPLFEAMFGALAGYTKALAVIVGDDNEWLDYYQFDCELGAKPLTVIDRNGKEFVLDSVGVLALLIVDGS